MSKKGAKCLIISNHKHVRALYYANFVFLFSNYIGTATKQVYLIIHLGIIMIEMDKRVKKLSLSHSYDTCQHHSTCSFSLPHNSPATMKVPYSRHYFQLSTVCLLCHLHKKITDI